MRKRTIKIPGVPDDLPNPCPCVYALRDPDTNDVRYVGFTTNIHTRYWAHLYTYSNTHNPELIDWIQGVRAAGKMPACEILDRVTGITDSTEAEWIRKFYQPGILLNRTSIWGSHNNGRFLVEDGQP